MSDYEVRRLQVRGSIRLRRALRRREQRLSAVTDLGRGAVDLVRTGTNRYTFAAWVVALGLLLFGSRELIADGVPAYGRFFAFPDAAGPLLRQYLSGWWPHGLGAPVATPTGVGLVGLGGVVALGAMGLLRTVLVVGLVLMGFVGMWRLTRPLAATRARIAGLVVYAACPLPYNAMAEGRWGALASYAVAPFVLARLGRLSRLAPFGEVDGERGPGVPRRGFVAQVAALGLVVGLVTAFAPAFPLVLLGMAAVLVLASLLVGNPLAALRALGGALAAAGVGVALNLPWSAGVLTGEVTFGGVPLAGPSDRGFWALVRFETGPYGAGVWPYAFWVAAIVAVGIGRSWRFAWAGRSFLLAVASVAVAWGVDRGLLDWAAPTVDVLLVPAALGLAFAVACGGTASELDLRGARLGWRQPVAALAAFALGLAAVPMALATIDGRWQLPRTDLATPLSFLPQREPGAYRILWVGDPRVMPLAGWRLTDGVAFGVSQDGPPDLRDAWPGRVGRPEGLIRDALLLAADGATNRLGAMLGPMAVRYVVVPSQGAPAVEGTAVHAPPEGLLVALASQLDLRLVDIDDAITVYENTSWLPGRSLLGPGATDASTQSGFEPLVRADLTGNRAVLPPRGRPSTFEGAIPEAGRVLLSSRADARWVLEVDGTAVPRSPAFGWANAFDTSASGPARLRYDTPVSRLAAVVLQVALWLVAVAVVAWGAGQEGRQRRRLEREAAAARSGAEVPVLIDLDQAMASGGAS